MTIGHQQKKTVDSQTTKGHSSHQGGLRGHSIGEDYPISVMYEGIIGQGKWVVWNTLTNEVYGKYINCAIAHTKARYVKKGLL